MMVTTDERAKVAKRFAVDIAQHGVTIDHASGAHRHLSCRRENTFAYGFHITTWPGYLCISGDMGCFVFARLTDMFEFFRGDEINPSYWAEKLQAHDKSSGHREFSEAFFREAVLEDFAGWHFENDDDRQKAREALDDDFDGLLDRGFDTVTGALQSAMDYRCPVSDNCFTDFWEHSLEDYTPRFLWCCYAIQWAVRQFDELNSSISPSPPASIDEGDALSCFACGEPFKADDICATDIAEGTAHAACLEGAAIVDLETGEPSEGPIETWRYGDRA